MKTNHLNAIINSFIVISETMTRLSPSKGKVSKKETLETEKPYIMFYKLAGEMEGYVSIAVEEQTLMNMAEQIQNNGETIKELSMDVINRATEFLGQVKTNMVSRFKDMGIDLGIERADFIMNNELPKDESDYIQVIAETHIGEFEISIRAEKKQQ